MRTTIVIHILYISAFVNGASDKRPHSNNGVLQPYDGKPIPFSVTADQETKLEDGQPVVFKDFKKFGGRGVVIQDINANEKICMKTITDITEYPKKVPRVKKVVIYEQKKYPNGTISTGARMDVKVIAASFAYFLKLKEDPKHGTYTWTLDYRYSSDFEDNVGHWQVMKHPQKKDWSRVLYSTKVQLGSWVPKFVVNVIIKSALTESTTWVKKEAEATAKKEAANGPKLSLPQALGPFSLPKLNGPGIDPKALHAVIERVEKVRQAVDRTKAQFEKTFSSLFSKK